jgi:hypothetical protein
MRTRVLSGAVVAVVVVLWAAAAVVAVGGAVSSLERPDRRPVAAAAPGLAALDRAILRAQPFLDGLYAPREDGTATISEYYGLPVRARFAGESTWQLLGAGQNRITRVRSATSSELGLATFRSGDASVTGWLSVDWRTTPGRGLVSFSPLGMTGTGAVELALQGRHLWTIRPEDVGGLRNRLVPVRDRELFRSHRFTIRHATNDGEQYARYRGQRTRAWRLGAASRAGGFPRGRDAYAALWNASSRWGDAMPFSAEAYADCTHEPAPDAYGYAYVSKTCSVPSRAYLWLSSFDPLVRMLQGLHVLERHGDPDRPYQDRDHLRVRVSGEVGRWEALFRRQDGMPRCSPVDCDDTWSSGVRTAAFGALETELGYAHGDRVSRTYADRAAAVVLSSQTPRSGLVRTPDGPTVLPLQAGGFATAWRPGMVLGFSRRYVARKQDEAIAELAMPQEYVGLVASNAESSMAAYAFLVRYRCRRYGVGCRAQFAGDARDRGPGARRAGRTGRDGSGSATRRASGVRDAAG